MEKIIGAVFDTKPNNVEIYQSGVDVFVSMVETELIEQTTGTKRIVWVCDLNRYTLLEYIYLQQGNYESSLYAAKEAGEVAAYANDTAEKAIEIAQVGNEYTQAGKIMLGEV